MGKFFITGGCGFIGSYIAQELIEQGDEVVAFDAFLDFVDPQKSTYKKALEMRLEGIKNKMIIIRGDVRNKSALLEELKNHKPDIVIHLAAIPIANKANEFPEEATAINLNGVVNVLECFRELNNIQRFVYTSSSFVYGDFQYSPADEKHPVNPIDVYGGTKLAGEVLTRAYSNKFGIDYTIIRPSAVYGPGDSNRRVSQVFIENALKGEKLKLYNSGTEKIDFTYVLDTAHGFVLAAKSKKAVNETFNITTGNGRRVREFAEIVAQHIPKTEVVDSPTDMVRPQRGTISIEKAQTLLGYKPKYSLETGIPKYIESVRANRIQ